MQRNISRREFGKRLAGGAALLALQPAWNDLAAAQSLRNDLKDLSGEWSFDEAVLQTAADDFGHVVHKKPIAMLRPGDAQAIAKLVQFANRQGLKVAMRGQGHSFFGQTQVAGGVVVDSSSLNAVRIVKSGAGGTAEMGPGSKWHPVLMAANAQKLTVPVIADTFLSVGGTISTGGFGVTTYNLGLQVDHVQELEIVTGDGQIVTCSDMRNSDLFNAMLGGLGQCGIITKVVMRLMAAPTHVLFIKMDYDDFQSASADLALLAKDGRTSNISVARKFVRCAQRRSRSHSFISAFPRRDTSSTRRGFCHRLRSPRFLSRVCRRGAVPPSNVRSPACRMKRSFTGSSSHVSCRPGLTPRP
jgi:cytokinin dehydrogenase